MQEESENRKNTPAFFKLLALDALSVASAAIFGYASYHYLTDGFSLLTLVIIAGFFGMFSALQALLSARWRQRLLVLALEVIFLLAPFYYEGWSVLALTGVMVLLALLWGNTSGSMELENSISIPFFRVSGDVLKKITTAILLFLILIYAPQVSANGLSFSQQSFKTFFAWTARIANVFFPAIVLNDSYLSFAKSVAIMELSSDPKFQALSDQAKAGFIDQKTAAVMGALSGSVTNPNPGPNEPVGDVFYLIATTKLNAWHDQSPEWFTIEWAVILFLILRALGILFVWLMQFLTLLAYQALLAFKFAEVTEKSQTKEVLNLGA